MTVHIRGWKHLVRGTILFVLLLDFVLIFLNWRSSSAQPESLREERARLELQHRLLKADVERATAIRSELARVQGASAEFFAKELREASTGYSSVSGDLNDISKSSGLRATAVTFRQRDVGTRGVVEIVVTATVEGDYPSLVGFINGLERSGNFYVLDSLQLASSTGGSLKLNLQLRTYFRS